jgi:hypothetical protein
VQNIVVAPGVVRPIFVPVATSPRQANGAVFTFGGLTSGTQYITKAKATFVWTGQAPPQPGMRTKEMEAQGSVIAP